MLVLSRKKNEGILIGDDVEVHVVEICGDKVRLGFKAPRSTTIHRTEVAEQIRLQTLTQAQRDAVLAAAATPAA